MGQDITTTRRLIAAMILLIMFGSVTGCGRKETATGDAIKAGPIRIGFIGPLSGSQAPFGQSEVEALNMELDEINVNGGIGGRSIELIVEDDRMDPATAVTAVKKLIEFDEVVAIIGDLQSGCTMAIAPIVEQAKVPMITPIATSPAVSDAGDYVFRTMPGTETQAELLAKLFTQRGFNKIAGICVDNEFGKRTYQQFKEIYKGNLSVDECHQQDDNDFQTLLTKIRVSDAQAIMLSSYPKDSGLFLKQARAMDIQLPIFGVETVGHKVAKDAAGDAFNGVYYTYPTTNTDPGFKKKFIERFNHEPEFGSDTAYDALGLIVKAIKSCGTEGTAIKDCLYTVGKGYKGVSGEITFDANGDAHRPATLYQVRNMTAVEITQE